MKKYLLIATMGVFFTISCQKDIDQCYSCDKEVNNYVMKNYEQIKDIDRKDLLKYDLEYQKAIFRAMSPERRFKCWKNKFEETLKLNWDIEEKKHISDIKNKMQIEWFDYDSLSNLEFKTRFEDILLDWISTSINKFGWSEGLVFSIIGTLDLNVKSNKLIEYRLIKKKGNRASDGNCTCSTTSDWCDISGQGYHQKCVVHADNCTTSHLGCGTLWTYDCDGKCKLFYDE